MSKLSLLERIIFSENFDKFHYMNNFQKSLCPDDINAFFILAEEDIRIDEFIEADLSSITYGELRPDKIGINLDTGEYYHVEFESTGPSRVALFKHARYISNFGYRRIGGRFNGISITTSKTEKRIEVVDYGNAGKMYIKVLPYYAIDGDELLKIVKSKNKHNIPLNRFDIWFLGFGIRTRYSMEEHEMLLEIAKLTNNKYLSQNTRLELKLVNAIYCLDNIDEKYKDEIMEVLNMELTLSKQAFRAVKLDGKAEGIEEGKEQGKKEGRNEALKPAVLNMLVDGFSDEKIMEMLNISKDELISLMKN